MKAYVHSLVFLSGLATLLEDKLVFILRLRFQSHHGTTTAVQLFVCLPRKSALVDFIFRRGRGQAGRALSHSARLLRRSTLTSYAT